MRSIPTLQNRLFADDVIAGVDIFDVPGWGFLRPSDLARYCTSSSLIPDFLRQRAHDLTSRAACG
jgi:hypothetical protein